MGKTVLKDYDKEKLKTDIQKLRLIDEMTTMLDALNQAHIWNFILEYADKHGMSILAITHNQYLAEKIATRIIRIPEINHIEANKEDL